MHINILNVLMSPYDNSRYIYTNQCMGPYNNSVYVYTISGWAHAICIHIYIISVWANPIALYM